MKASDTIRALRKSLDSLIIIHYSCEGLDDTNEGLSPRITSIAALHVGSMTMHSFSIHLVAEIEKIPKDEIDRSYDRLEARMLDDFFAFASTRSDCNWLHWKMSNINFGFETLEHRFRVHHPDNQPYKINDSKKYDLSSLILIIYGEKCVDHPHMPNLMELNGGKNRDVLSGKEEVEAFKAKEYVKLHKSTMSKVYWFKNIFFLLAQRKVVTSHSNWPTKVNDFSESWFSKLAGIVALCFVFFQIAETAHKYLGQKSPSNNPVQPSGLKK